MTNDYIVKPVQKALQVLLFLASAQRDMTLTEIAHSTKLPKTTAFRYLQTLCANGFVRYDRETDNYHLGTRLWELGQMVGRRMPLRTIALPYMQELRDRYNETVNLGVLDNHEVVYVEMVESHRTLRMQAMLGGRDPVYSTALGKAILAFLPDAQWSKHLPPRLPARTSNTLTTLAMLQRDLLLTRERGYALDIGENEDGTYCVGVPIRDHRREVVGALSLSAPAGRLSDKIKEEIPQALMAAASAISARLGFTGEESALT